MQIWAVIIWLAHHLLLSQRVRAKSFPLRVVLGGGHLIRLIPSEVLLMTCLIVLVLGGGLLDGFPFFVGLLRGEF